MYLSSGTQSCWGRPGRGPHPPLPSAQSPSSSPGRCSPDTPPEDASGDRDGGGGGEGEGGESQQEGEERVRELTSG